MPVALSLAARACALLGGVCMGAVALMVASSIVGRALWARPVPGDVELTQFGIGLAISLCLPWCQLRGGHITVDFFTQRTPAAVNRRLDAVGGLLMAGLAGLLAWRTSIGALASADSYETTMILSLPMWWAYAALAPGLGLSAVIALVQAGQRLKGRDPAVPMP